MEHASSPPLGRSDGPGTPSPPAGAAPRTDAAGRADPWGRQEGRTSGQRQGNGPWTEQPGPWSARRPPRMGFPHGWRQTRPGGEAGAPPGWPGRGETLRRIGGFALLACSLWLVAILAFFQAIIRMFS